MPNYRVTTNIDGNGIITREQAEKLKGIRAELGFPLTTTADRLSLGGGLTKEEAEKFALRIEEEFSCKTQVRVETETE